MKRVQISTTFIIFSSKMQRTHECSIHMNQWLLLADNTLLLKLWMQRGYLLKWDTVRSAFKLKDTIKYNMDNQEKTQNKILHRSYRLNHIKGFFVEKTRQTLSFILKIPQIKQACVQWGFILLLLNTYGRPAQSVLIARPLICVRPVAERQRQHAWEHHRINQNWF